MSDNVDGVNYKETARNRWRWYVFSSRQNKNLAQSVTSYATRDEAVENFEDVKKVILREANPKDFLTAKWGDD